MGWPNFGSPLLRPLVQGATCTSIEAALLAGREPTSTMSISRHHWQGRVVTRRIEARSAVQTRTWSGRGQYGTHDQARPPPSSAFWFHHQKHRREAPTATARDPIRREQAGGSGARARLERAGHGGRRPTAALRKVPRKLPDCGAEPARLPVPLQSEPGFPSTDPYHVRRRSAAMQPLYNIRLHPGSPLPPRRERRRRELNAQPQCLWRKRYDADEPRRCGSFGIAAAAVACGCCAVVVARLAAFWCGAQSRRRCARSYSATYTFGRWNMMMASSTSFIFFSSSLLRLHASYR